MEVILSLKIKLDELTKCIQALKRKDKELTDEINSMR